MKYIFHIVRIATAALILFTLPAKFGAAPESVELFTKLGTNEITKFLAFGGEPVGRYVVGSLELIAGILVLVPKTTLYGALMVMGLMAGAFLSHALVLGFGGIFPIAVAAFVLGGITAFMAYKRKK